MWPNSLLGPLISLIYGSRKSKHTIKPVINNSKVYYLLGHKQFAGRGPPATRFSDFTAGRKVWSWMSALGGEIRGAEWLLCVRTYPHTWQSECVACINLWSKMSFCLERYPNVFFHIKRSLSNAPCLFGGRLNAVFHDGGVNMADSGAEPAEVWLPAYHSVAVRLRFLGLSFLVCVRGAVVVPDSQGNRRIKVD